jgi:hypothetical protein
MSRRLLARSAPFVLGAVAAGLWLHHRRTERPQLREVTGELPPPVPPARRRVSRRFVRRPISRGGAPRSARICLYTNS